LRQQIEYIDNDDNERKVEETLSDIENSLFDWVDNSSVSEDLPPIHGKLVTKESENEDSDSLQDSMSGLQDGASVTAFTWE
jgi:hypothetical protein